MMNDKRSLTSSWVLNGSLLHFGAKSLLQLFASFLWIRTAGAWWWTPDPGVSWQWQITGDLELSLAVDMYILDLFDITESQVTSLRERGVFVICSFSAGTYEADATDFGGVNSSAYGEPVVGGDDGALWLDITQEIVLLVMKERLDLAVNKTCNGVDPSNVEVFDVASSGLNVTAEEQIIYNTWLAEQAHGRNLSIGLRNDWTQLTELEDSFDWALSENCLAEGACDAYQPNFVAAGKAVLDAEYFQYDVSFCDNVTASGLDVVVKDQSLDERRCSCQDASTDISCNELLHQSPTTSSGAPSYWVIAVAVGASIVILIVAATIAIWRRRKFGGSRGGGGRMRMP